MAVLVSDFIRLAKSLIKLAEENGVNKEAIQKILNEETKAVYLATGKHWSFESLLKDNVDVDFVVCLERKNDKSYYFE
jgi:NTE family protein